MVQTRGNKSSKQEIERRQFWVQRLYFQKLNCQQIVEALKQLGFNVEGSTVYRDLQDIRTQTKQIIEKEKIKTVTEANAELEEIKRCAWDQYHRKNPNPKFDDRLARTAVISEIRRSINDQNQLLGLGEITPKADETNIERDKLIANILRKIPESMHDEVLASIGIIPKNRNR